jgi:hypothetical protein
MEKLTTVSILTYSLGGILLVSMFFFVVYPTIKPNLDLIGTYEEQLMVFIPSVIFSSYVYYVCKKEGVL